MLSFQYLFELAVLDEVPPTGGYDVEIDEGLLEGVSFAAWCRVAASIQLPPRLGRPGGVRMLTADPKAIDAALDRDRAASASRADASLQPPARRPGPAARRATADRRAIERGEDEGMALGPE